MFNLTTGMEMIGFFNKNGSNTTTTTTSGTPSCSKAVNESTTEFYQHAEFTTGLEVGTESSGPWQDDSSLSLAMKQMDASKQKQSIHKGNKQWDDENGGSSSMKQPLHSLDFMELQKRKTKLLSMLEELDRRYKHYCDQMKAVVLSFEAVAGIGAASVYSALASKAMSRHFRCLRDGIVGQIQATRKAMGEKDPVAPGTTKGETPRLRILDQALRQQRSYHQMNMMESHPWRPQRGLPERSVSVSNWFINARVRLWKPMVEEMYLEETKEHENNNMASPNGATNTNQNDQKPTPDQLVRVDSECLSSIVTNLDKNDPKSAKTIETHHSLHHHHHHHQQQSFATYGAMELDFSSYNHHQAAASNGGGVSLTLGLQQHGGNNGVSLAFSPTSQSSLFYPRSDQIEDCQPVQYSLLDAEGQHLPYRSLMGAQLLHDLAG
ncbi:hypothetical protein Golob_024908 [Gossypium lobatum]|uniref:POX domain-containing protein n=1 Tax=Gossypium lobatum TaxID=34289 RepID=A0A7J8NLG2_9ROSI|nr:hypothetical protein [Gossypium lobatum]